MEDILIIDDSIEICHFLSQYVLPELGYRAIIANTGRQGLNKLRQRVPALILLDLQLPDISGLELLRLIAQERYDVPVILMTAHGSEGIAVEAFRLGARNYMIKPFSETEAQAIIEQALRERRLQQEKEQLNRNLQQRVQELTVLYAIGKSVSSLLDQEEVLVRIVEAGVYITHAEEGFLLLHDAQANELYLRAAKNIGEARAQSLRMAVDDTLAGQVIRTAKPVRLDKVSAGTSLKVKTGFLVQALLQVPLIVGNTVIGVLGVDNPHATRTFTENDQYLLSALADYAALAIANARLYDEARHNEKRYRDLFANAHDMIFTLDPKLRITSINKVGPAILGHAEDALLGRALQDFAAPGSWAPARRQFEHLLLGRAIQPFEMQLLNSDGETVYLEVSARLANTTSRSEGIHCIARNLTERRRLEEQLVQAEKLSALGQLVAGVAHELNNPLTSISGYTQLLLREQNLAAHVHDDLTQIHRQAERAARIVQGLLVFAREHKPERRMINLNDVIQDTLTLRIYQLKVDDITVVQQFDPDLPLTVADPFQLQQVVLNLINNAHQAMTAKGEPGQLTLKTELVQQPGSAPMIRFSIADTGTGIPKRDLTRIFDPFFTTKPVGQGTGLGLSICFGIVQEHGGHIHAESDVGVGTTVVVDIPLITEQPQDMADALHDLSEFDHEPFSCRVLVVEDEDTVGAVLARLLRELGHQPMVVTSGSAALAALQQDSFDVVLTDIKMPGLDGFELHAALRRHYPELAERIVFVSGDTLSPATQTRLAQSGVPFIEKPFAIYQLEHIIRKILARRSLPQAE
jgi:two-component system NtrC family sensor kinase